MKTKNVVKEGLFALLLLAANVVFAQTSISGTVVDNETGEAIPGANIIIQGTTIGTATDFDGNFTLKTEQNAP
ncbi:MAG: TonB-dependent receptor SusC [uncultured Bacteroidota bacterium]|nr:MAG: TonB-dependent receptor SusC [uncultured Bacteroidetes bacterium]